MAENNNGGKHTIEDVLQKYAQSEEGGGVAGAQSPTSQNAAKILAADAKEHLEQRKSLKEAQAEHAEEAVSRAREAKIGWMNVPLEDLPSHGIFYPVGTEINVRAATGGDLRKWSMLDETELQDIDNAINDVIERCMVFSVNNGDTKRPMTLKDLKEIDRLYIALCIRDFTFTEGNNELKIDVSETEQVPIKKDNISFIELPEGIFKYYNNEKRCFTFTAPERGSETPFNIYLPSVGVNRWLREYARKKYRAQEQFDEEFLKIAPMLINDYRKLNDNEYQNFILDSLNWSEKKWQIIAKVRSTIQKAVVPKVKYVSETEGGVIEKELPLNFHGGIRAIFDRTDIGAELGF